MARQTQRKKTVQRKNLQNRPGMILIMSIVLVLVLVVGIKSYGLMKQLDEKKAEYATNEETIQELEAEAQEIEEYQKYMQTPQYYEDKAREKWGLVYENEKVFVPED